MALITVVNKAGQDQRYLARIDTGASIMSIHAVDIKINGVVNKNKLKHNIGKKVSFTLFNNL